MNDKSKSVRSQGNKISVKTQTGRQVQLISVSGTQSSQETCLTDRTIKLTLHINHIRRLFGDFLSTPILLSFETYTRMTLLLHRAFCRITLIITPTNVLT